MGIVSLLFLAGSSREDGNKSTEIYLHKRVMV